MMLQPIAKPYRLAFAATRASDGSPTRVVDKRYHYGTRSAAKVAQRRETKRGAIVVLQFATRNHDGAILWDDLP